MRALRDVQIVDYETLLNESESWHCLSVAALLAACHDDLKRESVDFLRLDSFGCFRVRAGNELSRCSEATTF